MFRQMKPVEILVNGKEVQIGQPVGQVKSLEVSHMNMGVQVPKGQVSMIADWVWDLVQRCESEFVTYNGVLVMKSEVQQYKGR